MFVHKPPIIEVGSGDTTTAGLLSDLHIGNAFVDEANLKKDIAKVKAFGGPVAINGDVFDLILTGDKKRYNPTALHPRVAGRADIVNASVDYAHELLEPIASQIHFIGIGNHETAVEKHHSTDPVAWLIRDLNRDHNLNIQYGGYCGWWVLRFSRDRQMWSYKIHYHHGSGGGSPVTKGMIGFSRDAAWIDGADCLWRGHKHHKTADRDVVQYLDRDHVLKHKERLRVMSASYLDTYREQTSQDALDRGRRAAYASDWGVAPQAHGGVFIHITIRANQPLEARAEI